MALTAKRPQKTKKETLLEKVTENKEKKRLNAVVELELYTHIKTHCAHNNLTISEQTRHLWIEYLSKNSIE